MVKPKIVDFCCVFLVLNDLGQTGIAERQIPVLADVPSEKGKPFRLGRQTAAFGSLLSVNGHTHAFEGQ